MKELIPKEVIEQKIFLIRGQKVMLDSDLAKLYGIQTKVLNQAVKRNIDRFPEDFMFSLTREEILRMSQIVTSLKFSKSTTTTYDTATRTQMQNRISYRLNLNDYISFCG